MLQNVTIYRMTPSTTTDLDNKNTGDPPGDMVFNMDERAIPMTCRHLESGERSADCDGNNTHSWLLEKDLVYLQWEIEMDGSWGPYQECNLNLTSGGDGLWHCANGVAHTNWSDASACSGRVCPRTNKAVGWQSENFTHVRHTPTLSAECNASVAKACGSTADNYTACVHCVANHSKALKALGDCSPGLLEMDFCPSPPKPDALCSSAAEAACGFSKKQAGHECRLCLSKNRTMLNSTCSSEQMAWLRREGNFCPMPQNNYFGPKNETWVGGGWRPNHARVTDILGGSWFSTTTEGRCAEGHRPGDSSGCTWRPIGIRKALNYSCLQSNVAKTVMGQNKACFAKCADGAALDPKPPSDCWTLCFFNTFLGNSTLGLEAMSRDALVAAWDKSFASDDPAQGGCPSVPVTPPQPPLK